MANPNPNDKSQAPLDGNADDTGQSEALKKAILKLQESGMLSHMPDDLAAFASQAGITDADESPATTDNDVTIASRPTASSPTLASTSDDGRLHSEASRQFSAIVSGWEEDAGFPTETPETSANLTSRVQDTPQESTQDTDANATDAWDDWDTPDTTANTEKPPTEIAVQPLSAALDDNQAVTLRRKEIQPARDTSNEDAFTSGREQTPWTIQQFLDGEIDLEQELLKRFPTVPAMTNIKFRTLGTRSSRHVATLKAQDGSASVTIDADAETKIVQLSFTLGSMMTLRYQIADINASTRERWIELMRRENRGMAFLWNENRWRNDYLICIARQYTTNIYAFSPNNFESVVRLTKPVTEALIDWLEDIWTTELPSSDDDDAADADTLLTW